jgi:hypothetical protein
MRIQKITPVLLLVSTISSLHFCSCASSTGTGGSHHDTTSVKTIQTKVLQADDGTPGSHHDTTGTSTTIQSVTPHAKKKPSGQPDQKK